MHESSLMRGLMKQILAVAESHNAGRVLSIGVKLGALANITPAHFKEHFIEASQGTLAEGARLDITGSSDITEAHAQQIIITDVEVAR